MVEEFLEKLPEIDTRYEDIVPMERMNSTVSNGGGSVTVTMQRDDEYRNRMMKNERVELISKPSATVTAELATTSTTGGAVLKSQSRRGSNIVKISSEHTDSIWLPTSVSTAGGGHHGRQPQRGARQQQHQLTHSTTHHQQHQHQHHQQHQQHHQHAHAAHTLKTVTPIGGGSSSSHRESVSRRPDTTTVSDSTTYSREADEDISDKASTCRQLLIFLSVVLVILTMPFSFFVCFKVVQEYERAVIFRLGRLMPGGAKGPGIFFILPCIDSYARVDLRTRTYDVPPQEVLTKDSVTVSVDAVVYYRVSNATVSIANVENAHHSTRLLAQTTLRNTMGTRHLHEILSERETISGAMQVQLDEATDAWGIKVERVEIKDVRLPVQLQRAMAAEAEAAREARAKVIAAEGEQKASRALREASEVIGDSPAALQLRYLQTLNSISAEKNSTIVFPLPIDLITYFLKTNDAQTQQNAAAAAAAIASRQRQQDLLDEEKVEQQLLTQQLKRELQQQQKLQLQQQPPQLHQQNPQHQQQQNQQLHQQHPQHQQQQHQQQHQQHQQQTSM